jgi:hypothetical protein
MRKVDIKFLYNTYLRISRKKQNKPYKIRQNWDGFETSESYLPILKLQSFFERNSVVNIEDFFASPYEVYPEEGFYDLNFYNSLAAIKVYNIFCSMKNNLDPDTSIQIESLIKGLKFIRDFCIDRHISLRDYLKYKENGAIINAFVVHLKEKNITPYNLFAFMDFDKVYRTIDSSALRFILNDLPSKISIYRGKFYGSKKSKIIATEGLKKIDNDIYKKIS